MALYSSATCINCHRVRFVLAEKGINVDIVNTDVDESAAADLAELNPYNETPTLVDRDLLLYDAAVINDYLDERYPHPPLMPVDPVSRARLRLIHHRILRDWYPLVREIESAATPRKQEAPRKQLKESIIAANELFRTHNFLFSDELSLVDCTMGPLMWRLPVYGIKLGKPGGAVEAYAHRLFQVQSFKSSLTMAEREMILNVS
jgi:RNA polymerase-associated protein